jgi:hypothetical protein
MTVVKVVGKKPTAKKPEPTQNHGHKHKSKPKTVIAPPRAPADLGVVCAIGPRTANDDHNQPANQWFTHWTLLPLTPATISIQGQASWTDGLTPVNGSEHASFAGAQLENISFSGRLEPPAFYTSAQTIGRLAAVETGHWLGTGLSSGINVEKRGYTGGTGGGVMSAQNLDPLKTVQGPDGLWHVVESSQVGGPIDVNAEVVLQQKFNLPFGAPPSLPGGTDVIMDDGAIVAQGFQWHEPHDLAMMLLRACEGGEIVRMTLGDMYGINLMISIRSFTWRIEDSDPDVINYDLTARQHRANPMPTGSSNHAAAAKPGKSYVTKDSDTLHKIAQREFHDATQAKRIAGYNLNTLAKLWMDPDGRATGGPYVPGGQSAGPPWTGHLHGHRVGPIKRWPGGGITVDTYLRKGIRLALVAPKRNTSKKKK